MAGENLIEKLLNLASENGASDLHLAVGKAPAIRIDGQLIDVEKSEVLSAKNVKDMVYAILSAEQKEKFETNKDLDLSFQNKQGIRFRVNIHLEKGNVGLVARVIPAKIPTMEELGMPEVVFNLSRMNDGLILFTGPTGSGKSTSMAAMINLINEERKANIITLEDPIEFNLESRQSIIKQRQLGDDMLSFDSALKHVLRQDPNVVMVGEMRDLETIASAITLAETGHLVIATLHTYSAAQTIDRIIDIFPPHQQNQIRMQLSTVLNAVISQRLLPGIKNGRVATREILINNHATANLIRENKITQINNVIQTSSKLGMVSMDQDIKRLFKEGLISQETAESYMSEGGML
jgi:twitching motility protein PilT